MYIGIRCTRWLCHLIGPHGLASIPRYGRLCQLRVVVIPSRFIPVASLHITSQNQFTAKERIERKDGFIYTLSEVLLALTNFLISNL